MSLLTGTRWTQHQYVTLLQLEIVLITVDNIATILRLLTRICCRRWASTRSIQGYGVEWDAHIQDETCKDSDEDVKDLSLQRTLLLLLLIGRRVHQAAQ